MATISDTRLTTYIGPEAIFDGVTYRWATDKYVVVNTLSASIRDVLGQRRRVTVPFSPVHQFKNPLLPNEIEVYVDDVLWNNDSVEKTPTTLNITFDEAYIMNQRIISFSCQRAKTEYRYAIRARVYDQNDVVVVEFSNDENVPVIGELGDETGTSIPSSPSTDVTQPSTTPTYTSRTGLTETETDTISGGGAISPTRIRTSNTIQNIM